MGPDPVTAVANSVTTTTNPSIWEFMIQILPYDLAEMRWCLQPATHVRRFKMLNALDVVRIQMYYQYDGTSSYFSQVISQYLNHKFPNRWIGRGGNRIGHHGHRI